MFEKVERAYKTFDESYSHIEAGKRIQKAAEEKKAGLKKKFIIGLAAICFLISFFFASLVSKIQFIQSKVMASSMLVLGVIAFVVYKKVIEPQYLKNAYVNEMQDALEEVKRGFEIMDEKSSDLYVIPEDYRYRTAMDYIYKVMKDNRAETLNDALAMFDDQLHRWRMEDMQRKFVEHEAEIAKNVKHIRANTAASAAANVASIGFDVFTSLF